jgi:hypothetical protein
MPHGQAGVEPQQRRTAADLTRIAVTRQRISLTLADGMAGE